MTDPLRLVAEEGVAIWLDDMSRERLTSGNLRALVRNSHVVGVTTNPTIFHNAITSGSAYDEQLRDLGRLEVPVAEAIWLIATHDVRAVCDLLRPVHDRTDGVDGRVSIEVDPRLARETEATIAQARLLWWLVDRPNAMIKIPATVEGLGAITAAIAQGISVNVTLIFSLDRYRAVMDAYLAGLEQAHERGLDLAQITSVASFFISRVDTEIDARLDKIGTDEARALRGQAAIANARLAYQAFEETCASPRWDALEAAGALPQRPLWASTGVKDPAYDASRYVVELIAPQTVNTMPEPTLHALAQTHTVRGETVRGSYDQARDVLHRLAKAGVDYDDVVDLLERDGLEKFQTSWTDLLHAVEHALTTRQDDTGHDTSHTPDGHG